MFFFLCFFCFLQSTQISIPWYRVSFWQALNLPPRVPFAECVAQSASLNSVTASESVALHFISNHRNTLFPCSSFWYAPFNIKSYWSFLETTEKFHADMQKDSFLRWNISKDRKPWTKPTATSETDLQLYFFNYTIKQSDKPLELLTKWYWIEHLNSSDPLV